MHVKDAIWVTVTSMMLVQCYRYRTRAVRYRQSTVPTINKISQRLFTTITGLAPVLAVGKRGTINPKPSFRFCVIICPQATGTVVQVVQSTVPTLYLSQGPVPGVCQLSADTVDRRALCLLSSLTFQKLYGTSFAPSSYLTPLFPHPLSILFLYHYPSPPTSPVSDSYFLTSAHSLNPFLPRNCRFVLPFSPPPTFILSYLTSAFNSTCTGIPSHVAPV